ncbi:MAG: hypothetical protein ABJC19_02650 [Gemmatimonadota bacterium]
MRRRFLLKSGGAYERETFAAPYPVSTVTRDVEALGRAPPAE